MTKTFHYQENLLFCEQVSLREIVNRTSTPVYVYSLAAITNNIQRLKESLSNLDYEIYFAVKACSNIHILSQIHKAGCGADIVSGGELFRACLAQIPAEKIVFSGVGKTPKEIEEALKAKIAVINVESLFELKIIEMLAQKNNTVASICLRVNPNIDAKTHAHVTTGTHDNKFGFSLDELGEALTFLKKAKNIKPVGLSCHIGSQIKTLAPFKQAWASVWELSKKLPFKVERIDIGGGLGISYGSESSISIEEYGREVYSFFKDKKIKVSLEPGRILVADSGVLVTRVLGEKVRNGKKFCVLDAGMNDLLRPALYGSSHPVFSVQKPSISEIDSVSLVGPVCENADCFQKDAEIPKVVSGDLLAFGLAGAYGFSMASQYNSRPRSSEVLVQADNFKIIRSAETYADLVSNELL
ncbi:MAG: diaminopimelate decarboxylase [Bacteriovoracia bacterium]